MFKLSLRSQTEPALLQVDEKLPNFIKSGTNGSNAIWYSPYPTSKSSTVHVTILITSFVNSSTYQGFLILKLMVISDVHPEGQYPVNIISERP